MAHNSIDTILKLFPWFAFIAGNAVFDFWRIKEKDEKPIYLQSFIVRGMAAILHAILFDPQNVVDWLPVLIFQLTSFWIFFELLLNGLRREPFLYVGAPSGWLDGYFLNHHVTHVIFKMMALIVLVLSTVVIFHK